MRGAQTAVVVAAVVLLACAASGARAEQSLLELSEQNFDNTKPLVAQKRFNGAASKISATNSYCVICQYLVERIRGEMLVNGLGGGVPFTAPPVGGAPENRMRASPGELRKLAVPQGERGPEAAALTALLEVDSTAEAAAEATREKPAHKAAPAAGTAAQQFAMRRERELELLKFRPRQVRFAHLYDGPSRAAHRAEERFENNVMYQVAFQTLEDTCARRMPQPFYEACAKLIADYQRVASGLRWKDRPDAICQRLEFCGPDSYVQQGPHAVYRDQ